MSESKDFKTASSYDLQRQSITDDHTDGLDVEESDKNEGLDLTNHLTAKHWTFFGHSVPKPEIIFFSQVVLIYIVVITALINITTTDTDRTVWITLLCSCLGYLLPNPKIETTNGISSMKKQ